MENMNESNILVNIYRRLEAHFGPTGWWPGDSPFEVAVGAILTQNTAWVNVEKAIANLKESEWLTPELLITVDDDALHEALRPSGYFRLKTVRLRNFCRYLVEHHGGCMETMAKLPVERLRLELLAIQGIGPETADCILLYACGKPVFVIDAYTRRVLGRHGIAEATAPYEALRHYFEEHLTRDEGFWKEYHALFVYVGKDFCRSRARCDGCPLRPLLRGREPAAWPRDP